MSKTVSRVYIVTDKQNGKSIVPVRATNPSQAINYATRDRFSIRVATGEDMYDIGMNRITILDSTIAGVHPDQQNLPLDDDDKGGVFGGVAA